MYLEKICLIVPIYNAEQYIEKTVKSILKQTYKDFYTIFINDGSTDKSILILKKYMCKNFYLLEQNNQGSASARNLGIDFAINELKANWILFSDSDDVLSPFYVEFLFKAVKSTNLHLATCKFSKDINELNIKNDNLKFKIIEPDIIYQERKKMKGFAPFSPFGRIFSTDLFVKGTRFPYGKLHEDGFIIPELLLEQKSVVIVDSILYYYNVRENSNTTRAFSDGDFDRIEALNKFILFSYSKKKPGVYLYGINTLFTYIKNSLIKVKNEKTKNYYLYVSKLKYLRKKFIKKYFKNWKVSIFDKYRIAYLSKKSILAYLDFILFFLWSLPLRFL